MKIKRPALFFFVILSFVARGQSTVNEWSAKVVSQSDSFLTGYFGAEYAQAHFRLNKDRSNFKETNRRVRLFDSTDVITQPIDAWIGYDFCSEKKYQSFFSWIHINAYGEIEFADSVQAALLRQNKERSMVTDET